MTTDVIALDSWKENLLLAIEIKEEEEKRLSSSDSDHLSSSKCLPYTCSTSNDCLLQDGKPLLVSSCRQPFHHIKKDEIADKLVQLKQNFELNWKGICSSTTQGESRFMNSEPENANVHDRKPKSFKRIYSSMESSTNSDYENDEYCGNWKCKKKIPSLKTKTICYCRRKDSGILIPKIFCNDCTNEFHLDCLKTPLKYPPLFGDRSYIFKCASCFSLGKRAEEISSSNESSLAIPMSKECFRFKEKSWIQIIRIAMYNMLLQEQNVKRGNRIFTCREIYAFIDQHWKRLCYGKERTKTWRSTIAGELSINTRYFIRGTVNGGIPPEGKNGWQLKDESDPSIKTCISPKPKKRNGYSSPIPKVPSELALSLTKKESTVEFIPSNVSETISSNFSCKVVPLSYGILNVQSLEDSLNIQTVKNVLKKRKLTSRKSVSDVLESLKKFRSSDQTLDGEDIENTSERQSEKCNISNKSTDINNNNSNSNRNSLIDNNESSDNSGDNNNNNDDCNIDGTDIYSDNNNNDSNNNSDVDDDAKDVVDLLKRLPLMKGEAIDRVLTKGTTASKNYIQELNIGKDTFEKRKHIRDCEREEKANCRPFSTMPRDSVPPYASCYCQKPEIPRNSTLLCCEDCGRWLHINCLKVPIAPIPLKGDQSYSFQCVNCNEKNAESFSFKEKSWVQITRVALYNLLQEEKRRNTVRKFFRYGEICSFIDRHWNAICYGKTRTKTWTNTVASALSSKPQYFTSGKLMDTSNPRLSVVMGWKLNNEADPSTFDCSANGRRAHYRSVKQNNGIDSERTKNGLFRNFYNNSSSENKSCSS